VETVIVCRPRCASGKAVCSDVNLGRLRRETREASRDYLFSAAGIAQESVSDPAKNFPFTAATTDGARREIGVAAGRTWLAIEHGRAR